MAWTRRNPLALAILTTLAESPRHPYDIAATLKKRSKHESIRLNYGALYSVVDRLGEHGFIEATETEREGNRPERTTYRITPAGVVEMTEWLSELLSEPAKEYRDFEAALSLMLALPPDAVLGLLEARLQRLDLDLAQHETTQDHLRRIGLPRVFTIENELAGAHLRAEREVVAALITDIGAGTMEGIGLWRSFHDPTANWEGIHPLEFDWRSLDTPTVPTTPRPSWPCLPDLDPDLGIPDAEPQKPR